MLLSTNEKRASAIDGNIPPVLAFARMIVGIAAPVDAAPVINTATLQD